MSHYLNEIKSSSKRLLNLLDRDIHSPSRGLFSRNFWHFKISDFPSAAPQMGMAILAKLWKMEDSGYYQSRYILELIEFCIEALSQIQHKDGSFDEWYVNERGWAGPTGYVMNAALDCYDIIKDNISPYHQQLLEKTIVKGIRFLVISSEGYTIVNHLAIALLPIIQAQTILGMSELDEKIDNLVNLIVSYWNDDEGWSLEYDGSDPGYQSATLSFLAKVLKYKDIPALRKICLGSLSFISYFCFPSGVFSGALGSRHTVTLFNAGVEAFRWTAKGARLSRFIEESILSENHILPRDLDDHYFIYRLNEYCDAYFYTQKVRRSKEEEPLPWERESCEKIFLKAGIFAKSYFGIYLVISFSRGGAFRIESINDKKTLLVDNGIVIKRGKKKLTTLWQGHQNISFDELEVKGNICRVSDQYFHSITFILFRLFCLLTGFNHRFSFHLKKMIKKILIIGHFKGKDHFTRKFEFKNQSLVITDELHLKQKADVISIGGEFWTRYVPQSRYFLKDHLLHSSPSLTFKSDQLKLKKMRTVAW